MVCRSSYFMLVRVNFVPAKWEVWFALAGTLSQGEPCYSPVYPNNSLSSSAGAHNPIITRQGLLHLWPSGC
jgi:hypothetical protein